MKHIISTFLLFAFYTLNGFSQTGYIDLKSEPSDAEIYIDGNYKGTTPKLMEISTGNHTIEIRYKNYETQSLRIYVKENEVSKQTITLIESSGFKVKKEQSSVVNQAKGQLTVITDPSDSQVAVDGQKVDQKTPVTLTELGAGDHEVIVTNYLYKNGNYETYSITENVHIKPNKTKLLKINFTDYFGTLNIKTDVEASLKLDSKYIGRVPQKLEFIEPGQHNLELKAYLKEPYNDDFTIYKSFTIKNKETKDIYVSFYDYFKLGKIEVSSNHNNVKILLTSRSFDKNYNKVTGFNGEILTGEYTVRWEDIKLNSFDFEILEDKVTKLYLPVQKDYLKFIDITHINSYQTFNTYKNRHYNPLNEYEYVKELAFDWHNYEDYDALRFIRGFGWITMFPLGTLMLISSSDMGSGWVATGATLAAFPLLFQFTTSFHSKSKKRSIPKNIAINENNLKNIEKEYNKLKEEWNKEVKSKNDNIRKENEKIEEENSKLPPASVSYQKK